jgi:hypothetical protein
VRRSQTGAIEKDLQIDGWEENKEATTSCTSNHEPQLTMPIGIPG